MTKAQRNFHGCIQLQCAVKFLCAYCLPVTDNFIGIGNEAPAVTGPGIYE